jgi:hypothetical protein
MALATELFRPHNCFVKAHSAQQTLKERRWVYPVLFLSSALLGFLYSPCVFFLPSFRPPK